MPCVFNLQLPQLLRQPRGALLRFRGVPAALQPLPVLHLRQTAAALAAALHGHRHDGQHQRDVDAPLHLRGRMRGPWGQSAGLPAQEQPRRWRGTRVWRGWARGQLS